MYKVLIVEENLSILLNYHPVSDISLRELSSVLCNNSLLKTVQVFSTHPL
jgi:hypothetical protein